MRHLFLKYFEWTSLFFPGGGGGGGIRECAKNLFLPATNPVAFKTGGYVILTAYRMQPARAGGSQPSLYKVFKSFCRIQNTCCTEVSRKYLNVSRRDSQGDQVQLQDCSLLKPGLGRQDTYSTSARLIGRDYHYL